MSFGYDRQIEGSSGNANETVFLEFETPASVQVIKGNGTTNFGRVPAGHPLGKITATSKYRPCGKQIVDGAQAAVTAVLMQDSTGFFVGDVITGYDVSAVGTLFTGRTITAISGETLTVSGGAITYEVGDYIYVEDGSGTARGFIRDDIFTIDSLDENGAADAHDKGALLVFEGTLNETAADAVCKLNTHIKTDVQTVANGCHIIFR